MTVREVKVLRDTEEAFLLQTIMKVSMEFNSGEFSESSLCMALPSESLYRKPNLTDVTINRLRFEDLGIYGRDKEMKRLEELLHEKKNRVLFIQGESGSGKTTLAQTVATKIGENGIFIKGKFSVERNVPYPAITEACSQLCGKIISLQEGSVDLYSRIKAQIVSTLGEEIGLAARIIPGIADIIGENVFRSVRSDQDLSQNRRALHHVVGRFFRVFTEFFSPFVLAVDDIHWATKESFAFMKAILNDEGVRDFYLIACFRPVTDESKHPVNVFIKEIHAKAARDTSLLVESITLGPLAIGDVVCLIQDLLHTDDESVVRLAEVCHRKTLGNAFFTAQYLSTLSDTSLLEFNLLAMKWTWNLRAIEEKTAITRNVVDLIQSQIRDLVDDDLRKLLQIAACLGPKFKGSILGIICKDLRLGSVKHRLGGLLEKRFLSKGPVNDDTYVWVHDKIQEAVLSTLTVNESKCLRAEMSSILISKLNEEDLGAEIFLVTDLLNEKSFAKDSGASIAEVAGYNLRAGQKSMETMAFHPAFQFATKGLALLSETSLSPNLMSLYISLNVVAANAATCLGEWEAMDLHCDIVIASERVSLLDKIPLYQNVISRLNSTGKNSKALSMGLNLLERFGCTFPRSKVGIAFSTIYHLSRLKRRATTLSDQLSSMEMATDEMAISRMELLGRLITVSYQLRNPLTPILILSLLDETEKYGACEASSLAYAMTSALFLGFFREYAAATIYAKRALDLISYPSWKSTKAKTLVTTHFFSLGWVEPLHGLRRGLLEAYEVGLEVGDLESAFWGIWFFLCISLQVGRPLDTLASDHKKYHIQMSELHRNTQARMCSITMQFIQNLIQIGSNESNLSGDLLNEERIIDVLSKERMLNSLSALFGYKLILCSIYGNHQASVKLALDHPDLTSRRGAVSLQWELFHRGLSFFDQAQKTGKRMYRIRAQNCLKIIQSWSEAGNPNVIHYEALLNAENALLQRKNHFVVKKSYMAAIALSTRSGFIHDAALMYERFGTFLLEAMKDKEEATCAFNQSMRLFREWGALGKVEQMKEKYKLLL